MATLNWADLYGGPSSAGAAQSSYGSSMQVTGPNPSAVTSGAQAGQVPIVRDNGAAFTWVGFALALVLLRIALEAGGEVR